MLKICQAHHPSALDMLDEIRSASKGKQIVMFLDYDGTLSPIVDDPDRAFMSHAVSICIYTHTHTPTSVSVMFRNLLIYVFNLLADESNSEESC